MKKTTTTAATKAVLGQPLRQIPWNGQAEPARRKLFMPHSADSDMAGVTLATLATRTALHAARRIYSE